MKRSAPCAMLLIDTMIDTMVDTHTHTWFISRTSYSSRRYHGVACPLTLDHLVMATDCDVNSVCGVMCSEIDLMEANRHAFRGTAHAPGDSRGAGAKGVGGEAGWSTFTPAEYGPGGSHVDTSHPFQLSAAFHMAPDDHGALADIVRAPASSRAVPILSSVTLCQIRILTHCVLCPTL